MFCDRANITRLLHTTGFDRIVPVCENPVGDRLARRTSELIRPRQIGTERPIEMSAGR